MNDLPNVEVVDLNFQGVDGVIASYLTRSETGGLGLIETGPTSTLPTLLAALEPYGGTERLSHVVVTHIHLDHAGAVGKLLEVAPHVTCYVHERGRKHLIAPERLLRSATMIYGDRMDSLWGEVVPAPEDRVISVNDGDVISLPGLELQVLYTPGHAIHHIALGHEKTRSVFTGDVGGVRLAAVPQVRPPTPPPDLDPTAWRESIAHIRAFKPTRLLLTHFGPFEGDIDAHFDELLVRLDRWIEEVRADRSAGTGRDQLVDRIGKEIDGEVVAAGGSQHTIRQFELATPSDMTVDGILYYLTKQEQAAQS